MHQEMHATKVKIETAEQCEFKDVFFSIFRSVIKVPQGQEHKDYNTSTVLLSEDLVKRTSKNAHIFRKKQ